jgi:acyl transferase domain-containing protein/NADP-dependent 3-hydroxy acid dehydrogenase YdfG
MSPRGPLPADIAIIGMSVILPGAPDLHTYWDNLLNKVCAIRNIPADRWLSAAYFDPDRDAPDKIYSGCGGFIDDVPFDPAHFGLPPVAVPAIDPSQLLALVAAETALADAGLLAMDAEQRRRAAVILGFTGGLGELGVQYAARAELPRALGATPEQALDVLPRWTSDSFAGLLPNVIAGRIANRFDLGGASFVVDAACAASLAALRQAVIELETGRSDLVICGGVETGQGPFAYTCFSKAQALSPTARCRPFDAAADGTLIAEGVAMLVLKRLDEAEADGNRVYAIIKGVDGSSDGRARSLMAPLPEGQKRALEGAYRQAGYAPSSVELFEAHGTGTVAGDAAEIESLSAVLTDYGAAPRQCAVGSVKTLIGHTKGTAGMAGLIKVALALHHRVLPPHAGVEQPNPALQAADCPIALHQQPRPWLKRLNAPRRAGVSAFGFGGANYHVTLEEHAKAHPAPRSEWPTELFVWRAPDRDALAAAAAFVLGALQSGTPPPRAGLAQALAAALRDGPVRLAIVAQTHAELRDRLAAAVQRLRGSDANPPPPGVYLSDTPLAAEGQVAMLFAGQGSQYPDMLRELAVSFGEVRAALEDADAIIADTPTYRDRADRQLSRLIYPPDRFTENEENAARQALAATDAAQPALGAVEVALLALAARLGLQPQMAAGHSYGEYVALHAAGVLTRRDLLRASEARGRFIKGAARAGDLGTMAAVAAGAASVRAAIAGSGAVVANINAPTQTVISGTRQAVAQASALLAEAGVQVTPIPVSAAFHSALMQPAQAPLARFLEGLTWAAPRFPVYANNTATPHAADPAGIRAALQQHLTEPVNFQGVIEAMYAAGARVFVEIGPKAVLTGLTRRILGSRPHCVVSLDGNGGGLSGLLHALGMLFAAGVGLDLSHLFEGRGAEPVDLTNFQTSSPPRHSPTMWLVNGTRARPATASPVVPKLTHTRLGSKPGQSKDSREINMDGFDGADPAGQRGPPHGGVDLAMAEYHQTMRQFLQVQERLMLAYLTGGDRAPRPFSAPLATPAPRLAIASRPMPAAPPAAAATPARPPRPPPREPGPVANAPAADAKSILLKIASERTGYPEDMLGLDLEMEADLGIDSIKRVEILGAFTNAQPAVAADRLRSCMPALSKAKSLQEILNLFAAALREEGAQRPFDLAGKGRPALSRYVIRAASEPLPAHAADTVVPDFHIILPDRVGIAPALARRLHNDGAEARIAPNEAMAGEEAFAAWFATLTAPVRGVVALQSVRPDAASRSDYAAWREGMETDLKALFPILRLTAPGLIDGGIVAVASLMGGHFGRDALAAPRPYFAGAGGSVGLVKSLAAEWPNCCCKAIDLDPREDAEQMAAHIHAELAARGGRREVGYPAGTRTIFRAEQLQLATDEVPLCRPDESWVVLAVGGGRGITAETLRPFAATRATCIIVGRSPLPKDEPAESASLPDAAALRAHLLAIARRSDQRITPAAIEARIAAVLRDRETLACLADFRAAGATLEYHICDARQEADVSALLRTSYDRYGRIDAVLFGAGLIEDRLITDKTRESLSRVIDTKVNGAFLFARHIRPDSLRFFALFTSVAGRYGNRGQTDYAAANEVLNRFAWQLQAAWGPGVKVAAINWGPWARTTHGAGMLTPETTRQFLERGLQLIEPEEGSAFLMHELLHAPRDEVEVIAGNHPWDAHEAAAARIDAPPATASLFSAERA